MLLYGSKRIRKQRTISSPRKMKSRRTKTKAAFCSSVRKGMGWGAPDADSVLPWRCSAILSSLSARVRGTWPFSRSTGFCLEPFWKHTRWLEKITREQVDFKCKIKYHQLTTFLKIHNNNNNFTASVAQASRLKAHTTMLYKITVYMFYSIKSSSQCTSVKWFIVLRTVSSLEWIISLILRRSNPFLTGFSCPLIHSLKEPVSVIVADPLMVRFFDASTHDQPWHSLYSQRRFPQMRRFLLNTVKSHARDTNVLLEIQLHEYWVPGVWITETRSTTLTPLHLWFYLSNVCVNIQPSPPRFGQIALSLLWQLKREYLWTYTGLWMHWKH